jgi:hypothetical protein
MAARHGMMTYLMAAFLWRWNLLAFGAGVAFSLLSPSPSMFFPLVAAAEIAYLGLLAPHPKFQKAVDARRHGIAEEVNVRQVMDQIRKVLKRQAWERFERLRDRCKQLNHLAVQFRGPDAKQDPALSDLQSSSLERLLWLFLKLLYSQDALEGFLNSTDRTEIQRQIEVNEKSLELARSKGRSEKLLTALEDKLAILRQRLENYDHAKDNCDLLAIELDRIEQKVHAIGEMMLNSRNTGDIGAQVDGIAEGVSVTEEALRGLDITPVLSQEQAPKFLSEEN